MWKAAQDALSAALQLMPSKARICRLSPTVPVMKDVWANWAAVMSITVLADLAWPLTTKWPLLGSAVPSQSWYLVMASPSPSMAVNRSDGKSVRPCWGVGVLVATAGAVLVTVNLKGDHAALSGALQSMPSNTRIC